MREAGAVVGRKVESGKFWNKVEIICESFSDHQDKDSEGIKLKNCRKVEHSFVYRFIHTVVNKMNYY